MNGFAHIPAADSLAVTNWVAAHGASTTATDPRVLEWLGANPGKTAQEAIKTLLSGDAIAALAPAIRTWSLVHFEIPGVVSFNLNATFVIGAILMFIMYGIQQHGIFRTARAQKVLAIIVLVPLLLIGLLSIVNGSINYANFSDLVPPSNVSVSTPGSWNNSGWTLVLAGIFIATLSTYGFETAVCYTRELRNPAADTFKAIVFSGVLCVVFYFIVPLSFQGVLGLDGMLAPSVVDGSGTGDALSGVEGRLASAVSDACKLARRAAPCDVDGSRLQPDPARDRLRCRRLFLRACRIERRLHFNFLNLSAGWIHRMDSGHVARPWKAPDWLIGLNIVLAFANLVFVGAGGKVWQVVGARADLINPLWAGLVFAALVIPIFCYRHHVQDGGKWPAGALEDLGLSGQDPGPGRQACSPS